MNQSGHIYIVRVNKASLRLYLLMMKWTSFDVHNSNMSTRSSPTMSLDSSMSSSSLGGAAAEAGNALIVAPTSAAGRGIGGGGGGGEAHHKRFQERLTCQGCKTSKVSTVDAAFFSIPSK